MKLILASTSKYRAAQLKSIGLEFESVPPLFDEAVEKRLDRTPPQLAQALATKKAEGLANDFPDDILIGGDQVVALGSHIFNKPETSEKAVEHLKILSGQTHQLFTAMTLIYRKQKWEHTEITHLSMRTLSEKTIRAYVKFDHPVDCAGAYKLESGGAALFEAIQTKDPSAIMGVPLIKLIDILLKLGYPLKFRRPNEPK